MELSPLLDQMSERKASDLHLAPGIPPIFRVNGTLTPGDKPNLTTGDVDDLLRSALPGEKLAAAKTGRDFSATLRHGEKTFRCRVFREREGLCAAIRTVPDRIPSLAEVQAPPIIETLSRTRRGLILFVGPTGSGKATTMLSLVEHVNMTRSERIVTVESPIHYVLKSKLSLISQRIVGEDVESFEEGIRSAQECDADILVIGNLLTPETARLAMELADVGYLVLAMMTAHSVADALARLLRMFPQPDDSIRQLLADTLTAVIAQKLLPASPDYQKSSGRGRVAAYEILLMTPLVRQMLGAGQTDMTAVMASEARIGMQTMGMALSGLREAGKIRQEVAEG